MAEGLFCMANGFLGSGVEVVGGVRDISDDSKNSLGVGLGVELGTEYQEVDEESCCELS